MSARPTLLAALLAMATPGAPGGEAPLAPESPPSCEVDVSVEPSRAFPGQQVRYRLRLLVRSDVHEVAWEEPPRFPGLRAERLAATSLARSIERAGVLYQLREDARALFADRPGRVVLPSARLVCLTRGEIRERSASIATPESVLVVVPFPETGLPPDFDGLVGPMALRHGVTSRRIALGQSLRISVTLQGEGNLWDAREPQLESEALDGAEVFPRPAQLVLDRGTTLVARRQFTLDVVPRREGVLHLPPLAWRYFDPATERFGEVVAEAVDVAVGPPAPVGGAAERSPDRLRARAPRPGAGEASPAPPLAGVLAALALLLLGAAAALGRPWLRRRRAVGRSVAEALAAADAARSAGDRDGELAALARALRAAVAAELGAVAEGSPEERLAAGPSPGARAAAELLAQVERARFDPSAVPPERAAVLRALGASGGAAPARRKA